MLLLAPFHPTPHTTHPTPHPHPPVLEKHTRNSNTTLSTAHHSSGCLPFQLFSLKLLRSFSSPQPGIFKSLNKFQAPNPTRIILISELMKQHKKWKGTQIKSTCMLIPNVRIKLLQNRNKKKDLLASDKQNCQTENKTLCQNHDLRNNT